MGIRTGKSKSRLEEIRKEVETEARKLGDIQSEYSRLTSANEVLRKEKEILVSDGESLSVNISEKESKIEKFNEELRDISKKLDDSDSKIAAGEKEVYRLSLVGSEVLDRLSALDIGISEKTNIVAKLNDILTEKQRELDTLTSEIATSNQQLAIRHLKNKEAEEWYNKLQGDIEETNRKFKIYEKRISQFSADTGYLVGYQRPEMVLENN